VFIVEDGKIAKKIREEYLKKQKNDKSHKREKP